MRDGSCLDLWGSICFGVRGLNLIDIGNHSLPYHFISSIIATPRLRFNADGTATDLRCNSQALISLQQVVRDTTSDISHSDEGNPGDLATSAIWLGFTQQSANTQTQTKAGC